MLLLKDTWDAVERALGQESHHGVVEKAQAWRGQDGSLRVRTETVSRGVQFHRHLFHLFVGQVQIGIILTSQECVCSECLGQREAQGNLLQVVICIGPVAKKT